MSVLKQILVSSAKKIVPGYYWGKKMKHLKEAMDEVELKALPFLCDPKKTSLDIGASGGLFTVHMLDLSLNCIAFEPIPDTAAKLQSMLTATKSKATVENIALSDENGQTILRMLDKDLGRSTIESSNTLEDDSDSKLVNIKVTKRKLDHYKLDNIGFIKIDVEGHELSVLKGAEETIKRNLPALIIEIEERHKVNAVEDATEFLSKFGYQAFFIMDGQVKNMSEFKKNIHQDPKNIGSLKNNYQRIGVYINNFIFLPPARVEEFKKKYTEDVF